MLKNTYSRLSRREFATTAVAAAGTMLLGPMRLNAAADGVDPRIARAMFKTIGIDMHNHVYPAGTEPHPCGQLQHLPCRPLPNRISDRLRVQRHLA